MYSIFEIREPDPPYYGVTPVKPETTLRERLARNVRLLRVMRGWSQEELALEAGGDCRVAGAPRNDGVGGGRLPHPEQARIIV